MKLHILTFLLVLVSVSEGAAAQLSRISSVKSAASTQIYAYFDELPSYRQRISKRRLDLTLFNTSVADILPQPDPDAAIVKSLVFQEQENTILSFFFRYLPQNLIISTEGNTTLIIDLIPGNRFTGAYRQLSSSLGLLSPVSPERETTINPLTFSPYRNDWRSFIENFASAPQLDPAPQPFFPPFPLISLVVPSDLPGTPESLPIMEEMNRMDRFESLRHIQQLLKAVTSSEERKYYAIVHADVLFRLGSVEAARSQFNVLADTYPDDIAGDLSLYAAALLDAQDLEFHVAQASLQRLLERLPSLHPLYPYVRLALAETSLATGQYQQMKQLLEIPDIPSPLQAIVELRRADLAFATGRLLEAFTIYDENYETGPMSDQPYSLNGYCTLLKDRQADEESQLCYQELASLFNDNEQIALASYLAAQSEAAAAEALDYPVTQSRFTKIIERYPGTGAALRAELKLADNCFLEQANCGQRVTEWYRGIADQANARDIAQEASFKEAIIHHLEGERATSIYLLQQMLREFQSGILNDQALALLIQLLPGEIERLLDTGQDIKAIALAQQNRTLFENGWLDDSILLLIGQAFERLAIYPEALQLYLYLKHKPNALVEEAAHFAALRAAHALGDYRQVEDLATEYSYRYPGETHQLDILFYRLDCKYAVGHIDEALSLLPEPVPQRNDFILLAASLYFHKNNFARTADLLLPAYRAQAGELSDDQLFMLAESLFEMGDFTLGSEIFELLAATDRYRQSARYRLAQLPYGQGTILPEQPPDAIAASNAETDQWQRLADLDERLKVLFSNL